jgi:hypothetical protein
VHSPGQIQNLTGYAERVALVPYGYNLPVFRHNIGGRIAVSIGGAVAYIPFVFVRFQYAFFLLFRRAFGADIIVIVIHFPILKNENNIRVQLCISRNI